MARYLVQIPRDSLSDGSKADIACAITSADEELAGGKRATTEVAITEIDAGCFFMGGILLECDRIFVHGYLPALRSLGERKDALRVRLAADVTKAAGFEPESRWVTLTEL